MLVVSCMQHANMSTLLRTCLIDCNNDYIGIEICITRNARCCNVILITIDLFSNNTRI